MAEFAGLEEYQVYPIPDEVTDEQGALIEPCAVAAYGVARGGVRPGDSVLIAGAGPIGALAALCTAAAGAGAIYITETNTQRRAQAERLGLGEVSIPTRRMWQRRYVNVPTALAWMSPSSVQAMVPPSTRVSTLFDVTGRLFRSASTSRAAKSTRCCGRSMISPLSAAGATG